MRKFQLILIKPSHYDDDGYVIRWWRAMIPSNSLAAVYGIAADCAERRVLGADVEIEIDVIDETNTRVNIPALLRAVRAQRQFRHGGAGRRAVEPVSARARYRAAVPRRGHPGRARRLPCRPAASRCSTARRSISTLCRDMGISIFAGEAEGRLDALLQDAAAGRLQPHYNFMKDLPGIDGTPIPFLPRRYVKRTLGTNTSFDAGRGCPYQCSFCTIINVQGRKSRYRSPDDVERLVRENWAQGIYKFFITDDNFARNREWESIFDRLAKLREVDKIPLGLMIQVDTLCHKIPNFVEKAKRAGVTRVFIGLENINPDNLRPPRSRRTRSPNTARCCWPGKTQGIFTLCRLHPGLPGRHAGIDPARYRDHPARAAARRRRVLLLTPLPGSEDHQVLWRKGVDMDPDLNKYDLEHVVHGSSRR